MRIGSLCYATNQGLGILAKDFYDHRIITDFFIVGHSSHPNQLSWYPQGTPLVPISQLMREPHYSTIRDFCKSVDVMLFFETPFDWSLLQFCRQHNVKTAIMPMHECMPRIISHQPDLWLCPSLLDLQWADKSFKFQFKEYLAKFLPVPVDTTKVQWRQRTTAKVFVHNAGNGSFRDRNGTELLFEAMRFLKSDAKFIIRSQKDFRCPPWVWERQIAGATKSVPFDQLYSEGDAFIFCEKWNGLCLPLQEARAAGMLVIAGDRFPINTWLPRTAKSANDEGFCLLPPSSIIKGRIGSAYQEFDEARYDPKQLAQLIDFWYGRNIEAYSKEGREWAQKNSWEILGPQSKQVLEELCE